MILLMKKGRGKKDKTEMNKNISEKFDDQGYPLYPADEDIYTKGIKEDKIDTEDISLNKELSEMDLVETDNEMGLIAYEDLDDDQNFLIEDIDDITKNGISEEDESVYYSLRGDINFDMDIDKR